MSQTADLMLRLEGEARERAACLEWNNKLPRGFTARHYPLTLAEQRELRRLKAAGAAGTDAAVFVALCRGEPIPASRLNSAVLAAHRRRAA